MKRSLAITMWLLLALVPRSRAQERGPLDGFRAALARGRALVSVWGASHVASDAFTSALRDALVRAHGDGGAGQFFPARPLALYDRRDVLLDDGTAFRGVSTRGHRVRDDYGRAAMALDGSRGARACARLQTPATHFEAWARGAIRLEVDGTASERGTLEVPQGAREVCIEALEDHVRSFGVIAERASGVVVESFGVPGARAQDAQLWSESFETQLSRRPPDLFVLSYGTNESAQHRGASELQRDMAQLIARFRRGAPAASCLVIGPSDRPRNVDGQWRARAQSSRVRDAYRAAADASGCAFFDLLAWTGGPGSMADWALRGWALADRVHFTDASYERLGRELAALVDPPSR